MAKRKFNENSSKKAKKAKYFKSASNIDLHTAGIFATCNRGRERQATSELLSLVNEVYDKHFKSGEAEDQDETEQNDDDDDGLDIETQLAKEISKAKQPRDPKSQLFAPVQLGTECVLYIRTRKPVDPVALVRAVCIECATSSVRHVKYVQRLSPVTLNASATPGELEKLASTVLAPVFHKPRQQQIYKFAVRPTSRLHDTLTRDEIITTVARGVGKPHTVDLKDYDKLILVEIFKSVAGISIVDDFEKLKRFNLQQIMTNRAEYDDVDLPIVIPSENDGLIAISSPE